jgi:thiol-disulfide isomerase/thioredoxin
MPDASVRPPRRRVLAAALLLALGTPLSAGVVPGDRYQFLLDGEDPRDWKKPPAAGTEVGTTAKEIVGEDTDGKKFKLSHYRGRVVLLVFWGHWCGPCRAMYAYQRALLGRVADRPLVLLGVNSDRDRDTVKKTMADEKLTWRSFWDGGGPNGVISREWNVRGWPTLYLIDHKGVIRHKYLGSPPAAALDRAIDDLLKDVRGR